MENTLSLSVEILRRGKRKRVRGEELHKLLRNEELFFAIQREARPCIPVRMPGTTDHYMLDPILGYYEVGYEQEGTKRLRYGTGDFSLKELEKRINGSITAIIIESESLEAYEKSGGTLPGALAEIPDEPFAEYCRRFLILDQKDVWHTIQAEQLAEDLRRIARKYFVSAKNIRLRYTAVCPCDGE